MILVTLGTQKQSFDRLLNYIEEANINDKIIVQAGHTKFKSKKMEIFDFIDYEKMNKLIEDADIVITHGGTGSIVGPLKKGKIVIACARKKEYGEHVDNHQEQIVDVLSKEGYILSIDENNKIDNILKKIDNINLKKFESNANNFIKKLSELVDLYLI